jgi:Rod binding domain-containing protein
MSQVLGLGTISGAGTGVMTPKEDMVIKQSTSSLQNEKIEKSAKDFESILLGSWLQQAEQSFGSLPGADEDDDADSGKEQFQGIAMQSMGASLTAAGGIGIASMIAKQLHKAEDARVASTANAQSLPTK